MFDWTRAWIRLRREHAALRSGKLIDLFVDDETYVFARQLGAETILIAFNREDKSKEVSVPVGSIGVKDGVTLKSLIGEGASAAVVNGEAKLTLSPQTAMAFGVQ
jgi:alpha-glucosidase